MEIFIRDPECSVEVGADEHVSQLLQKVSKTTGLAVIALHLEEVPLDTDLFCRETALYDLCTVDAVIAMDMKALRGEWLGADVVERAPEVLWDDEAFVHAVLMRDVVTPAVRKSSLLGNKAFMIRVVEQRPLRLQLAPPLLQADEMVVRAALSSRRCNNEVFKYIAPSLMINEQFIAYVLRKRSHGVSWFTQSSSDLAIHCGRTVRIALLYGSWSGYAVRRFSETLRADRWLITEAIKNAGWVGSDLQYLSKSLKNNSVVIRTAIRSEQWRPHHLQWAGPAALKDTSVVQAWVKKSPEVSGMADVPEALREHPKVMAAVVKRDARLFPELSFELRFSPEVAQAARHSRTWTPSFLAHMEDVGTIKEELHHNPQHLQYIAQKHTTAVPSLVAALGSDSWEDAYIKFVEQFMGNKEFIIAVASFEARVLQYAPHLCADRDVVLAAVRSASWKDEFFAHVATPLLSSVEIMSNPIARDATILRIASTNIQANRTILLSAIISKTWTASLLQYTSEELRADKDVMQRSLLKDAATLRYLPTALRCDAEFLFGCLRKAKAARKTSKPEHNRLCADKPFLSACASLDPEGALQHAVLKMRGDKQFMLWCALHDTPAALRYASARLRADEAFMRACMQNNTTTALDHAPSGMRNVLAVAEADKVEGGVVMCAQECVSARRGKDCASQGRALRMCPTNAQGSRAQGGKKCVK